MRFRALIRFFLKLGDIFADAEHETHLCRCHYGRHGDC